MSIYYFFAALAAAVSKAAQFSDGKDFSRKSALTAETVIRLLIGAEGGSLAKILHDAGIQATASALSQRRSQIPPEVFRSVFENFNSSCTDGDLFRGYKLLAVDGTAVNLPRNPKSPSFVQNDGIPNGVNQLHVTPLYDIFNRTFADVVIQPEPKKDEIGALVEMLKRDTFAQKTLIIADRGFESYNLIAHCLEKPNTDFLIRIKQSLTQAVFSLRGKPLNSYGLTKKVVYENEEFNLLQAALNIEDGIEGLRYNKVIVATDADVDGMHIRLLIITFFLQFFPDLIKKGHVYILQTPLFRVRNKKKTNYCYTEDERIKAIEELGPNPEITRFKGLGEISPDEFKHFIGKDMRLEQVSLRKTDLVKELLEFYMGKNTMERQNFIIDNLVIEEDLAS